MSKRLLSMVLAGLLAAAVAGRAEAQTTRSSAFGCGMDECGDIWKFKCPGANTKYVVAEVCPATAGSQAFFNVTIVGKTPTALLGKGDIASGDYEACAGLVQLTRPTPGPISGYVTVSRWNGDGVGYGYRVTMACVDKNNGLAANPTIDLRTDQ